MNEQVDTMEYALELLRAERDTLSSELTVHKKALANLFYLIDENWLVRNIKDDDDPLWALKQLNYVRKLADAKCVLDSVSLELSPPTNGNS